MQRGIIRNIDNLGRIVIPREFRNLLELKVGESTEIFCEDDYVKIKKHNKTFCKLCGTEEDLVKFKNMYICNSCKNELKGE